MSVSRVGDLIFLPDSECRSLSGVRATMARSFAGRARYLAELAQGRNVVPAVAGSTAAEPSCTPLNPQGRLGVDLSGPPWGSALRHPIAWMTGLKPSSVFNAPSPVVAFGLVADLAFPGFIGPWRIWNRPHDKLPEGSTAPYARGLIALRAYLSSGAGTPTVTIKVRNVSRGQTFSSGYVDTFSLTGGSTETLYIVDTTNGVDLDPGPNVLEFYFDHTTSGAIVGVTSLMIYQNAKRAH